MKTLYLVRHAKSSWEDSSLDDFDRPLNNRGKKDAPRMGQYLNKQGVFPDLMLASPANRAFTTSRKIARELDYPKDGIQTDERIYHADETDLLEILREVDDSWNSVMLFGHNPAFTWFANGLNRTDIDNIPTCGVVACQLDIDHWTEVRMGCGQQLFFISPKKDL